MQYIRLTLVSFLLVNISAMGMNYLRPYDTLIRPPYSTRSGFHTAGYIEGGLRAAQGFNFDGDNVNVLQIWNCNQDTLAMLDGFPAGSQIDQLRIAIDSTDNAFRGHIVPHATLTMPAAGAFELAYQWSKHIWFSLYLPAFTMRLADINFTDLTPTVDAQDIRVRDMLTDNLVGNIWTLGCLELTDWRRTGVGDLVGLFEFLKDFPTAQRPMLKNVRINARVGLNFPTGLRVNPDELFAIPFGYDGALGIIYGGGLIVTMGCFFKTGFDVELIHLFGNSRTRRIKTAVNQTDLFLFEKTCVYRDYGLTQRFNLFVEMFNLVKGASFVWGYQFFKHGDDFYSVVPQTFSSEIANTAESLQEYTMHQLIFNLNYRFNTDLCDYDDFSPYISLYSRIPVNGKRSALFTTLGAVVGFNF